MSLIQLYEPSPVEPDFGTLPVQARSELLNQLSSQTFELVIVGGGLLGAALAHFAACVGVKTALVEREDYGVAGDLRAPLILAPELINAQAPQLWFWQRGKLLRELTQSTPALFEKVEIFDSANQTLRQAIKLEQGRWTRELILAARQEGAICVNHLETLSVGASSEGLYEIGARDRLNKVELTIRGRRVINSTGIDGPAFGRLVRSQSAQQLLHSTRIRWQVAAAEKERVTNALVSALKQSDSQIRTFFLSADDLGSDCCQQELLVLGLANSPPQVMRLGPEECRAVLREHLLNAHAQDTTFGLLKNLHGQRSCSIRKMSRPRSAQHVGVVNAFAYEPLTTHRSALKLLSKLDLLPASYEDLLIRPLPRSAGLSIYATEFDDWASSQGWLKEERANFLTRLGSLVRFLTNRESSPARETSYAEALRWEAELYRVVEQAESEADLLRRST